MKIEVIKSLESDNQIWFFVRVDGFSKLATRDENEAINTAKKFESNYKEFGVINPKTTIYSVEL